MILCTIDSQSAYPSTANKIKITLNNPYVSDSGEYTYEINFPLSVAENARIFGFINRIDVRKRHHTFNDCRLSVDGLPLISGKGVVISVSDEQVKLQIVGGRSRIKYDSCFASHYIDEIDYPMSDGDAIGPLDTREPLSHSKRLPLINLKNTMIYPDYSREFVLSSSWGVYVPVYNETTDCIVNKHTYHYGQLITTNGATTGYMRYITVNGLAIQPRLMDVLRQVLRSEGYEPIVMFDEAALCDLYIANTRKVLDVAKALPHWSVYTFLEEVAKLFNIIYEFNTQTDECIIYPSQWQTHKDAVAPSMLNDYSCDIDESTAGELPASMANLQYDIDNSINREWRDVLPADVRSKFGVLPYEQMMFYKPNNTPGAMLPSERQRRQAIFRSRSTYFVWASILNSFQEKDKKKEEFTPCGFFSPFWRDTSSDKLTNIRIIPAAMQRVWVSNTGQYNGGYCLMPSVEGVDTEPEGSFNDDDGTYSSVQECMEAGAADSDSEEETTEERMCVFFVDRYAAYDLRNHNRSNSDQSNSNYDDWTTRCPVTLTDCRAYPEWSGADTRLTLDLTRLQCMRPKARFSSANPLDEDVPNDDVSATKVNAHALYKIQFLYDGLPDPSKIYIFRNSRFVCQKIEIEVTSEGVSKVKTGYFYEIL